MKVLVFFLFFPFILIGKGMVPVYLEWSHAGSFYFIAENINLNTEHTLILFDKHSDASQILNSDEIREELSSVKDKNKLFKKWRQKGVIQCNNWIEPLLPKPISEVVWVYPGKLSEKDMIEKKAKVKQQINAHEKTFLRKTGDLSDKYNLFPSNILSQKADYKKPVIVSIDLDYFANIPEKEMSEKFESVFNYLSQIRNIELITICLSRPWLKSDKQAEKLLFMTLNRLLNTFNTKLYFEPFVQTGPDRSEMAKSYYRKRKVPPRYKIENSGEELRKLIVKFREKITVREKTKKWQELLSKWSGKMKQLSLYGKTLKDTVYIKENEDVVIISPFRKTSWYLRKAAENSYNITGKDYEFAKNSISLIFSEEVKFLSSKTEINISDLISNFSKGYGVLRIYAEDAGSGKRTKEIKLIRYKDYTFPGILTQLFNLPYILGAPLLYDGTTKASDTLIGSDCSSFIIYGIRKKGKQIQWTNPIKIKKLLKMVAKVDSVKDNIAMSGNKAIIINGEMIDKGVILHFRSHVAALFEDINKNGLLDGEDLIIHQLEGKAEIIKFKNLKYFDKPFDVMTF